MVVFYSNIIRGLAWLCSMYSRHTFNVKSGNAIYLTLTLDAIFVSGD